MFLLMANFFKLFFDKLLCFVKLYGNILILCFELSSLLLKSVDILLSFWNSLPWFYNLHWMLHESFHHCLRLFLAECLIQAYCFVSNLIRLVLLSELDNVNFAESWDEQIGKNRVIKLFELFYLSHSVMILELIYVLLWFLWDYSLPLFSFQYHLLFFNDSVFPLFMLPVSLFKCFEKSCLLKWTFLGRLS